MQIGGGPSTIISLSYLLPAAMKHSKMPVKREILREAMAQIQRESTLKACSDRAGRKWPPGWFCKLITIFWET